MADPEVPVDEQASPEPPAYVPHVSSWIYPIAAVVTRQLKLGEKLFPRVIHAYYPIDEKKYNVADDSIRKNPTLLESEMRHAINRDIHEFMKKFVEFKEADFLIHFIMPGEVVQGW